MQVGPLRRLHHSIWLWHLSTHDGISLHIVRSCVRWRNRLRSIYVPLLGALNNVEGSAQRKLRYVLARRLLLNKIVVRRLTDGCVSRKILIIMICAEGRVCPFVDKKERLLQTSQPAAEGAYNHSIRLLFSRSE